MTRDLRTKAGAVLVALLALAVLSSRASPGFPLAEVPKAVGRSIAKALAPKPEKRQPPSRPPSEERARSPSPTSPGATSSSTPTRPPSAGP